ncbi:MAG: hypothetical protein WCT31_04180 [Candidatus Micrarchaeia archaeon]
MGTMNEASFMSVAVCYSSLWVVVIIYTIELNEHNSASAIYSIFPSAG